MVGAVVEAHLEVHHRVACDVASGCRFLNALVHCGDVLLRNGTTHDGVLEDIAGAPGQALHLDPAVTELAAATGLFLVTALDLHLALDRLAVGNLGCLEDNVHLEAALCALDCKLDVQLAHAGEQDVARLLVVLKLEGNVVVQKLLDGCKDLVFLATGLGSNGKGDELWRKGRHCHLEGGLGICQGVAGPGILEL